MFTSRVFLPAVTKPDGRTVRVDANNGAIADNRDKRHGPAPSWTITNAGRNTISYRYRLRSYRRCRFVRVRRLYRARTSDRSSVRGGDGRFCARFVGDTGQAGGRLGADNKSAIKSIPSVGPRERGRHSSVEPAVWYQCVQSEIAFGGGHDHPGCTFPQVPRNGAAGMARG